MVSGSSPVAGRRIGARRIVSTAARAEIPPFSMNTLPGASQISSVAPAPGATILDA